MKVLGVVTARGGSKTLPGKNLKLLAGKPLIAYTIDAALQSEAIDRLILSTDDPAIADVALTCGCEAPFMRPPELARDETLHLPVVEHAARWMVEHKGYRPDAVMTLQPTSPLRTPDDIRASIELLEASGADSVLSVSEVPVHSHPMRTLRLDSQDNAVLFVNGEPVRRRINRRQDLPPAWVMNGAIYVCLTRVLLSSEPTLYGDRVVAYRMPAERSVSIDDADDWAAAERAMNPWRL
ncbi:MAG: cytidylyltransferase domain-containing protein [Vicinamibacterales bacterium]